MSLEKFQATDAWRNKFKNLLFTERKPQLIANHKNTTEIPQRLSFQLSEDLQVILEEKKIPVRESNMPRVRNEEENKENFDDFWQPQSNHNTNLKWKMSQNVDGTMLDDTNDTLQITNTSFETLEEMCEKTASDPDSTLFQYLRRGSPSSSTERTRASKIPSYDEEADALQRLLDELNVEETKQRLKGCPTSPNETQLDDIEAPSKFWDNTLTTETLQSISPVKMVGLMRQSTIMEESSDVSESDGSSMSYQSAMKTGFSSETTGCYETANETAACSEHRTSKKLSVNSSGASSSSELFQPRNSRQKFFNEDKKEEETPDKSLQLIDLDTTVKKTNSEELYLDSLEEKKQEKPSESLDSPEPAESSKSSNDSETNNSIEELKSSPELTGVTESDGSSSVIELSDDDFSSCSKGINKTEKNNSGNVLNQSFTIKTEEPEEEKSLHFNDTMEEVEYMMNKGMQYMQAAKENQSPAKLKLSPLKKADRYRSPSPMLSSPITPKTIIAKPKPVNKHGMDIKPFPKLELFKKPQASGTKPSSVQNKLVSSIKRQQYAHVVSPIGAYIKKTPTTPLVSTIKPGCDDSATSSRVFKQLEYDNRVSHKDVGYSASKDTIQKNKICSLPKKAYISSEYKHVVDERTQFTIPGGPKIQRYLVSSMIPAVVRHEGKVKIPTNLRTSDMQPPTSRRTDDSLADLSMVSGDVSVYTIKDAQRF